MNAVLVKGDAVGTTLYYGPGAGSEPTASAVIADLVDVTRMHTADPENHVPQSRLPGRCDGGCALAVDRGHGHLVLLPHARADQPGVLADITRILADGRISIDALFQREPRKEKTRRTSSC